MIAACGNDEIGRMTVEFMKSNGIDTGSLTMYEGSSRVALAFLDAGNNARYSFYDGQNVENKKLVFPGAVKDSMVLFASTLAIKQDIRRDLKDFLESARQGRGVIYYDPNVRPSHFTANSKARELINENICFSSIVKGSDEDFNLLFGAESPRQAYDAISSLNKDVILLVTLGREGVWLFTPGFSFLTRAPVIEPLSTIGAGDTFSAGILFCLSRARVTARDLHAVNEKEWRESINLAVSFAARVCMSYDNYIAGP
jgi:fructokinase